MNDHTSKMTPWQSGLYIAGAGLALIMSVTIALTAWPHIGPFPDFYIADELIKPAAFFAFMTAALLTNSFSARFSQARFSHNSGLFRMIGLLADVVIFLAICSFTFTYLHEIAIEKPFAFPDWMRPDVDPVVRMIEGQPGWISWVAIVAIGALVVLTALNWGMPITVVILLSIAYAVFCGLSSAYGWFPGNPFLNYGLAAVDPYGEIRKYVVVGDTDSLLGQFVSILISVVLPFILLGGVFAATGGGSSLIKLALQLTSKSRGGPAHAAIVASSLFGTFSGGPVVNVLSTGTLTIPMMIKRGFSPRLAGSVEAAASSGGQIMPPVMGVAAFFLANYTGVPYNKVVIAALIPAALYYLCLFISVSIEARKLGVEAVGKLPPEARMTRQDYFNLVMIFVPVLIIIAILITDSFSVATAGVLALAALLPLTLIDPEIRARPIRLFHALVDASLSVSRIFILFVATAIVAAALSSVGLPNAFGLMLSESMSQGITLFGMPLSPDMFLAVVLLMTMFAALLLGMGMPTLPAYANVAIVLAGGLVGLGLSIFTANMFIFYFAVASSITPPVAVAAFAASSITGDDPMRTAITSLRIGVSILLVPFIFAIYPELLLIDAAFVADPATGEYIASHPEGFVFSSFVSVLLRTILCLYLVVSALAGHALRPLSKWEILARLGLALLVMSASAYVYAPSALAALALILLHRSWQPKAASKALSS